MGKQKDLFMEMEQQQHEEQGVLPQPKNEMNNWERITAIISDVMDVDHRVTEGEDDGIDTLIGLKQLSKVVSDAIKSVESEADTELDKYGQDKIQKRGFEVHRRSGAGKYTYHKYSGYMDLENKMKSLKEKMKAAHKTKSEMLDPETGEIIPAAEYTPGKTVIAVKEVK